MLNNLNQTKIVEMSQKAKKQKGASMIEYALVVAGIAAIAAVVFTGSTDDGFGKKIKDKMNGAISSAPYVDNSTFNA